MRKLLAEGKHLFGQLSLCRVLLNAAGSGVLAFGMYHIHAQSDITEGGVLGFNLLLRQHLGISPALTNLVLTALCYFYGWRALGRLFLAYSAIAAGGFSLFYSLFSRFSPLFPSVGTHPLIACVAGAVFVGVGVGLCVIGGGAPTGDDALSMALEKRRHIPMQWTYLCSDLFVLCLSLSYIPAKKIFYSLITVVLSGQIIGFMTRHFRLKDK